MEEGDVSVPTDHNAWAGTVADRIRLNRVHALFDDPAQSRNLAQTFIHGMVLSNQPNEIKSLYTNSVLNSIIDSVDSSSSNRRTRVNISVVLNIEQQNALNSAYPGLDLTFSGTTSSAHPVAAASRHCEYAEVFKMIGYNNKICYKERAFGRDDYVVDIGGDFYRHFKSDNVSVHCCCPNIDHRDISRNSWRSTMVTTFIINSSDKISKFKRDMMSDITLRNGEYVCNNKFQECERTALYGIMIHSNYDVSLQELARGMARKKIDVLFGTFIFDERILYKESGSISGLDCEFNYSEDKKKLVFSFKNDSSWNYTHLVSNYLAYCTTSWFVDHDSGEEFFLELINNKLGVQYFKVVRGKFKLNSKVYFNHNIWFDALRNLTRVTYYEVDYKKLAEGKNKWFWTWKWISGSAYKDGAFKKKSFLIDSDLLNKGIESALGNTENKFKPTEIYNFLRSYNSRIFFGKDVVRRGGEVDPTELFLAANAIYIKIYAMKYDIGKVTQQFISDITSERTLTEKGLWGKLFHSRGNVFQSSVWPIPLFTKFHLWLYKWKTNGSDYRGLINEVVKFENYETVGRTRVYDILDGETLSFLQRISFPSIVEDNFNFDVKQIIVNNIYNSLGIKVRVDECASPADNTCSAEEELKKCAFSRVNDRDVDLDPKLQNGDFLTVHTKDCVEYKKKIFKYDRSVKKKVFHEVNNGVDQFVDRNAATLEEIIMFHFDNVSDNSKVLDISDSGGGFVSVLSSRDLRVYSYSNENRDFSRIEGVYYFDNGRGNSIGVDVRRNIMDNGKYDLITANLADANKSTELNYDLVRMQTDLAVRILENGGSLLLKLVLTLDSQNRCSYYSLLSSLAPMFGNVKFIISGYTPRDSTEVFVFFEFFDSTCPYMDDSLLNNYRDCLLSLDSRMLTNYREILLACEKEYRLTVPKVEGGFYKKLVKGRTLSPIQTNISALLTIPLMNCPDDDEHGLLGSDSGHSSGEEDGEEENSASCVNDVLASNLGSLISNDSCPVNSSCVAESDLFASSTENEHGDRNHFEDVVANIVSSEIQEEDEFYSREVVGKNFFESESVITEIETSALVDLNSDNTFSREEFDVCVGPDLGMELSVFCGASEDIAFKINEEVLNENCDLPTSVCNSMVPFDGSVSNVECWLSENESYSRRLGAHGDGNCCYYSLILRNDKKQMIRFRNKLVDDVISGGKIDGGCSYISKVRQEGESGDLDVINHAAVFLGIEYKIFVKGEKDSFIEVVSDLPYCSYRKINLFYDGDGTCGHYDAGFDNCVHSQVVPVDIDFDFVAFVKCMRKYGDDFKNFISTVTKCNQCAVSECLDYFESVLSGGVSKLSALVRTLDVINNLSPYLIKNRFSFTFYKVKKYYYVKFEPTSNPVKVDLRMSSDLINYHTKNCKVCSDYTNIPMVYVDNITRIIYGCEPKTKIKSYEVPTDYKMYIYNSSVSFNFEIERDEIVVRTKDNLQGAVFLMQHLVRRKDQFAGKSVLLSKNGAMHTYWSRLVENFFGMVVQDSYMLVKGDSVSKTFSPKFVMSTSKETYRLNAMHEIKEIWACSLTSVLRTLKTQWMIHVNSDRMGTKPTLLADVGIYDMNNGKWYVKPRVKLAEVYSFGFDGKDLIDLSSFYNGSRIIPNNKFSLIMVSSETRILVANKLYDIVKNFNVDMSLLSYTLYKRVGVPGCGKTSRILSECGQRDIILATTKEAVKDITERLEGKNIICVSTLDSYILHKRNKADRIWVDEALMSHYGTIVWAAYISSATEVMVFGDPAQIPYICRDSSIKTMYHTPESNMGERQKHSLKSYRCPADVMYHLNAMKVYTGTVFTYNKNLTSMKAFLISNVSAIQLKRDQIILTFTQNEKEDISRAFSHCKVYTVNEFQGKQSSDIVMMRTNSKQIDIYSNQSQILVAISRHTKSFAYHTVIADDLYHKINVVLSNSVLKSLQIVEDKDVREKIALGLKGQGVTKGNLDVSPASAEYEWQSPGTYDFLKKNREIRELVMNHCYPAIRPGTVISYDHSSSPSLELPYIQQNKVSNPINVIQGYFDRLYPLESCELTSYDACIFEMDDFQVRADGFRYDDVRPYGFFSKDYMVSTIRTSCPRSVVPTQRQIIKAFTERNGAVPELVGDRDYYGLIGSMYDSFYNTYIHDKELFAIFEKEKIFMNVDDISNWLNSQPPNVMSSIAKEEEFNIYEKELRVYQMILKRMPKPVLDKGGAYKYSSPQTIAFLSKMVNSVFCPMVREIKKRLISVLRKNVLIYSDMSIEGFEEVLNNRFPPKCLQRFKYMLEVDFSKYDKSQDELVLDFECVFMRRMGVTDHLVDLWKHAHSYTMLWDPKTKFKASIDFQRKSGDAMTFLGNTVLLMTVMACTYDLSDSFCLFSGDDSLVFGETPFQNEDAHRKFAGLFNLEAKLLNFDSPYFCSKFLLPVTDLHWKVVPDLVKTVIKLGRNDLVDEQHVEEYRISLKDNLINLDNAFLNGCMDYCLNERYGIYGNHTVLYQAISTVVGCKKKFSQIYYFGEDSERMHYNIRPSLEL